MPAVRPLRSLSTARGRPRGLGRPARFHKADCNHTHHEGKIIEDLRDASPVVPLSISTAPA